MRLTPIIVVLAPIVIIACEEHDGPRVETDCTDQGGLCEITAGPNFLMVACDGEFLGADQCVTNTRAYYGRCCRPKKCAEGRGICATPCVAGRTIYDHDTDCEKFDGVFTDCCEP